MSVPTQIVLLRSATACCERSTGGSHRCFFDAAQHGYVGCSTWGTCQDVAHILLAQDACFRVGKAHDAGVRTD